MIKHVHQDELHVLYFISILLISIISRIVFSCQSPDIVYTGTDEFFLSFQAEAMIGQLPITANYDRKAQEYNGNVIEL